MAKNRQKDACKRLCEHALEVEGKKLFPFFRYSSLAAGGVCQALFQGWEAFRGKVEAQGNILQEICAVHYAAAVRDNSGSPAVKGIAAGGRK